MSCRENCGRFQSVLLVFLWRKIRTAYDAYSFPTIAKIQEKISWNCQSLNRKWHKLGTAEKNRRSGTFHTYFKQQLYETSGTFRTARF